MEIIKNLRDKATAAMKIPESIFTEMPIAEILGTKKVRIENHNGIIKYTADEILFKTSEGVLKISGKSMQIESLIAGQTVIKGEIYGVNIIK